MRKIFLLFCLFCMPLMAARSPVFVDNGKRLALEGYDVTTYFNGGVPKIGLRTYQIEWNSAKWRFVSAENMRRFEKNPERFAPQYGGYCPIALAEGRLSGGLTNIWQIKNGKLYMLCSNQALEKWLENSEKIKQLADKHWPEILETN